EGTLLARGLQQAGIEPWLHCGDHGYFGLCRVKVAGEQCPPTGLEEEQLAPEDLARGVRLACQARVVGDVRVLEFQSLTGAQILTGGGEVPVPAFQGTPLLERPEVKIDPPTVQDQRPDAE